MRTPLLALLSLSLSLAAGCSGEDDPPAPSGAFGCRLEVRGAASEDLWCVVTAYDYSAMPTLPSPEWAFLLVAYRGSPTSLDAPPDPAAEVGFFLPGRPALNQPYGWSASASSVDGGSATRWTGSLEAGTYEGTHEALAPLGAGDLGAGSLDARFTAIPAADATGAQLLEVHGSLEGSLPAVAPGGAPVTLRATF